MQLLALGLLLQQRGYDMWDLGMGMEYKYNLGAEDLERHEFLTQLFRRRTQANLVKSVATCPSTNVVDLIINHTASSDPKVSTHGTKPKLAGEAKDVQPLSKNQLKKRRKLEKRLQRKKQNKVEVTQQASTK